MRTVIITVIMVSSMLTAKAQFVYDYLKAADNYYRNANYESAAEYYEKYLGTKETKVRTASYNPYTVPTSAAKKSNVQLSSRQLAQYRIAESYRQLHVHEKAARHYAKVLETNATDFPLARYHYATSLRALAKYEEAEKEFNRFLDEHTTPDEYTEAAKKEILSLRFVQAQLKKKDLKYYNVQKAATPLNSEGANYAPVWANENTLLFTTTREEGHVNQLYEVTLTNGAPGNINKLPIPQGNNQHQGVASLTPDGNTLYVTRWLTDYGKKVSSIYRSRKTEKGWSEPELMDSLVNAFGYSSQQPFVMPGGKYLLYASEKPGGYGGFDIWFAELDESGKPVRSANLGEIVNSVYDEQAPYYHESSGTLIFSGNGRVGMGGFDLWYSKGSMGAWNVPVNFGYPVNSVKDDMYFVSRGGAKNVLEDVWLSSDRDALCCLELFYLKKVQPQKKVSGKVVACNDQLPLEGVTVKIIDTINNKVVYTQTTGVDGNYTFTLDAYQPLTAVATASGYSTGTLPFGVPADEDAESLSNPAICLVKDLPPVETAVVLENVYYDFDKASLKPESHAALNKLADMMQAHPEIIVELSAHTDNIGTDRYNQQLSEARAKSCVAYLVSKGIDKDRLQAKGYGANQPIAPNKFDDGSDNPEGRQQNRRTEFKIMK